MGCHLNPTANGFRRVLSAGLYVDKSELIAYTNAVLFTDRRLSCVTRPRRSGKSFAAQMLAAYYTRGDDSRTLFAPFKINGTRTEFLQPLGLTAPPFDTWLNRCDVIVWDLVDAVTRSPHPSLGALCRATAAELHDAFPSVPFSPDASLPRLLQEIHQHTGRTFFFIIDEWDILFREAPDQTALQAEYLALLQALFDRPSFDFLAGAYLTGILPIRRNDGLPELAGFQEFHPLAPSVLAPLAGFTEAEVRALCEATGERFEARRQWYDGYPLPDGNRLYNPYSVIQSLLNHRCASYWPLTTSLEFLTHCLRLDFPGLSEAVRALLEDRACRLAPGDFANDLHQLHSRDNVLTLLVHLGYLAWDPAREEAVIPNEEIRRAFFEADGIRYDSVLGASR